MAGEELGAAGASECYPGRPDRGGPTGTLYLHVEVVPLTVLVTASRHGLFTLAYRLEQLMPEQLGIPRAQPEPGLELPGLRDAPRMLRIEAVQLEPCQIDDAIVSITNLHGRLLRTGDIERTSRGRVNPAANPDSL